MSRVVNYIKGLNALDERLGQLLRLVAGENAVWRPIGTADGAGRRSSTSLPRLRADLGPIFPMVERSPLRCRRQHVASPERGQRHSAAAVTAEAARAAGRNDRKHVARNVNGPVTLPTPQLRYSQPIRIG